ncbi:glycine/betaine ABC transporter substrate-binding protein [Halomonas alkaliantarctica]|nr:glycine/betaine ABC transporter substrate-binding protein [Halomonas alkaliantarctica]
MKKHALNHSVRLASLSLIAGAGLAAGSAAQADNHGPITLAYVEWSDAVASTNVIRAVLEQEGYEVETKSLSAAAMWQAVATGDADAMTTAWLPTTHENYNERLGDQMVDLGVNLDGTKLGLVVPAYSEVDSIPELNEHVESFNGEIIGIDPGAGLMGLTEEVIEAYDLDYDLRSGSGATMTAALANAIQNEENIVVTGWTPHWKFARFDLKYLDDPKNILGGAEQIHTFAREGLEDDMPGAYAILDAFEWTPEQMGQVQLLNQEEGSDPYENAKQWVENNPDIVNEWINGES